MADGVLGGSKPKSGTIWTGFTREQRMQAVELAKKRPKWSRAFSVSIKRRPRA